MNKITLLGRIGQKDEFNGGVSLSVATSEKYKNKQEETVEETQWHKCKSFGKQSEVINKYFDKGDQILLEGKLKYSTHEEKRYSEIIIERFYFVGSKKNNSSTPISEDIDDDLPF